LISVLLLKKWEQIFSSSINHNPKVAVLPLPLPKITKMKTIDKMSNIDRAYLLAQLFPDDLKQLTEFIKEEAERYTEKKEYVYSQWTEGLITAEFWYRLVESCKRTCTTNGTRLYRNPRTFRDQLFDGYDALFTINALIHFTEKPECSKKLKYAIYFLFGDSKLVIIDLKSMV